MFLYPSYSLQIFHPKAYLAAKVFARTPQVLHAQVYHHQQKMSRWKVIVQVKMVNVIVTEYVAHQEAPNRLDSDVSSHTLY